MTSSAAAGWFADPTNPALEHWWDGSAYHGTRSVAFAPAPPAPPVCAAAPATPQFLQPVPMYVVPPAAPLQPGAVSPKSRTVAVILGFFLGGLGVDRFYLGNIGMGVAKLLVGWLTFGIWPLVDWIIILAGGAHDGNGLPVINWN